MLAIPQQRAAHHTFTNEADGLVHVGGARVEREHFETDAVDGEVSEHVVDDESGGLGTEPTISAVGPECDAKTT